MADKKQRIHHLAKELMVKSKTIIEKCAAEGIEIKNHMHVVSAGLEATIREWFSEGAHQTTLEESQRVDLQRVRVKPKKRIKKVSVEEAAGSDSSSTATAIAEPPVQEAAVESAPPSIAEPEPAAATAAPTEPAAPGEGSPEPEADETPSAATAAAEVAEEVAEEEAPSAEPEASIAGPQNVPQAAKLSGPKVIRYRGCRR